MEVTMINSSLPPNTRIKASITAIATILTGVSIYPVEADSFLSLTFNLTTTTDYSQRYMQTEPHPGWVKIQDQANKSSCYQSYSTGQVLCELIQDLQPSLKPPKVVSKEVNKSAPNLAAN